MPMLDWLFTVLIDPFEFAFMQRALMISVTTGLVCAIFSCFLVLKNWSLMGDAVSHAVLPGICVAYILNLPVLIGAFCAGLFCALSTGYIKDKSRIKEDAVMGIVFSGMFAFGLVLISKIETDIHLLHILFGNVLGISDLDFWLSFAISVFCSAFMLLKAKDFILFCFDSDHARAMGLSLPALNISLLVLLTLTIVASLKTVGIILVIAMLIAPGATGFLFARRFNAMLVIACLTSVLSCVFGVILSFHLDVATAPLIVILQTVFFLSAFFWHLFRQNLVLKAWR